MCDWISIKDDLPSGSKNVLLLTDRSSYHNADDVIKGYYNASLKIFQSQECFEDEDIFPTHWMPLPKGVNK